MAEEVVMHVDESFAVDGDERVGGRTVGEVVEGEDDGAVGGVFKGDYAEGCLFVLDFVKDVWNDQYW